MKAIMPVLDDSRKKPYYLQLYDYIKEAILKGEIRENEKLPSLRSLSRSTGLSVTTVEQSYNQLLDTMFAMCFLISAIHRHLPPANCWHHRALQKTLPAPATGALFSTVIQTASISTSGKNA